MLRDSKKSPNLFWAQIFFPVKIDNKSCFQDHLMNYQLNFVSNSVRESVIFYIKIFKLFSDFKGILYIFADVKYSAVLPGIVMKSLYLRTYGLFNVFVKLSKFSKCHMRPIYCTQSNEIVTINSMKLTVA